MIEIHPIPILKDNYVWTIINTEKNTALIVDPGQAAPVKLFLEQCQLTLSAILITHHHWDHCDGMLELKEDYGVPVYGSSKENISGLTHKVQEKSVIEVENFPSLHVMEIPGHTLGHVAFYNSDMIFCGDTLFSAGCGRLFEGTAEEMYNSLQKIAALPDETKIYCGHEYTLNNLRFAETVEPGNVKISEKIKQVTEIRNKGLPSLPSSLHIEKETNPFLRCHSEELIRQVEDYAGKKLTHSIEVFSWLRKWKDNFK